MTSTVTPLTAHAFPTEPGKWKRDGNEVVTAGDAAGTPLWFGDPTWTDCDLELEANRTQGDGDLVAVFRGADPGRFAQVNVKGGPSQCAVNVLVDGKWDFVGGAIRIVRGDRTSLSIAAASILAKVTRDRIMRGIADQYPGYNFEANKGYPCPTHKANLQALGPSAIHRRSWVFMDHLVWNGVNRLIRPDPQLELPFET